MDKEEINHDEKIKKTIERLNDAGSYIVVAIFGSNVEIETIVSKEQTKKTIERLNNAESYLVIAKFGNIIEIATRGPAESRLLLKKISDMHLKYVTTPGFNKD